VTTTRQSITLPTRTLRYALNAVAPFASRDLWFRSLNSVCFESRDGDLIVTATDRYTAGRMTVPIGSGTGIPATVLSLADMEQVRYLLRRSLKGDAEITRTDGAFTVKLENASLTVKPADHEFPDLAEIYAAAEAAEPDLSEPIGLQPKLFARFAAVSRTQPARVVFAGPLRPVLVRIGDDFLGIIMPVRLGDGGTLRSEAGAA
jgi:DNA polymerase III sliding clamp (beta) subunit (PCNA family)